jgi:polyhydroxyalkanoate synthesis regulator phasin
MTSIPDFSNLIHINADTLYNTFEQMSNEIQALRAQVEALQKQVQEMKNDM